MTTIQEIKLQNCENRRRWEWEDKQADLYDVELKAMALQQKQEAGSVLINEIKNIFITFCAATSVYRWRNYNRSNDCYTIYCWTIKFTNRTNNEFYLLIARCKIITR